MAKPAAKKPEVKKPEAKKPELKTPAAKAAPASKPAKAAKPVPALKADKVSKPKQAAKQSTKQPAKPQVAKPAKPKMVRDSFTMPQADFDLVHLLKERALGFRRPTKKSELLRAGLQALTRLDAKALQAVLDALPALKAGRPKKGG
ncbi:MAG: hypothetical protein KAY56_09610 [Inhella sp.]|nr:hypothetical protein [Inhella sp.]